MPPTESPGPLRYELQVPPDGRIEVTLPSLAGSHVTVYVIEQEAADLDDLLLASNSSTDFWDSAEDDEDWNDA